jgi:SAM-dependent methyltransferase
MKKSNVGGQAVRLQRLFWLRAERLGLGGHRVCVCCGQSVRRFLPYDGGWSSAPEVVTLLDVIGSDLEHYECPRCGASDRERHLFLYCDRLGLKAKFADAFILHFAPEPQFARYLSGAGPREHVRADLFPREPTVRRVDIQAIAWPDRWFDVVIANHVLEHVPDADAAVREVVRVLKPGGIAILQTPYSVVLRRTFEDEGVLSEAQREFAYGQSDHVRLFGADVFDRITACGLQSRMTSHGQVLGDIDADRHGVNPREPFFLFERPS